MLGSLRHQRASYLIVTPVEQLSSRLLPNWRHWPPAGCRQRIGRLPGLRLPRRPRCNKRPLANTQPAVSTRTAATRRIMAVIKSNSACTPPWQYGGLDRAHYAVEGSIDMTRRTTLQFGTSGIPLPIAISITLRRDAAKYTDRD